MVSSLYPIVDVDIHAPNSEYFIGLKSMDLESSCVYLQLDADRVTVDPISQFNSVTYSYLQILFPPLLDVSVSVSSLPFLNQFLFNFTVQGQIDLNLTSGKTTIDSPLVYNSFGANTLITDIVASLTSSGV